VNVRVNFGFLRFFVVELETGTRQKDGRMRPLMQPVKELKVKVGV